MWPKWAWQFMMHFYFLVQCLVEITKAAVDRATPTGFRCGGCPWHCGWGFLDRAQAALGWLGTATRRWRRRRRRRTSERLRVLFPHTLGCVPAHRFRAGGSALGSRPVVSLPPLLVEGRAAKNGSQGPRTEEDPLASCRQAASRSLSLSGLWVSVNFFLRCAWCPSNETSWRAMHLFLLKMLLVLFGSP